MGLMDAFRKNSGGSSFDSFPDLSDYRIYLFLKGCDVQKLLDEYSEIYSNPQPFSTEIFNVQFTPWKYVVFTFYPGVSEICPMMDYLDVLLWMSGGSACTFAYACPNQDGRLPIIAYREDDNEYGDSCKGIANGKYFRADIPGNEVKWGASVPMQLDYVAYLRERYGIDVAAVIGGI